MLGETMLVMWERLDNVPTGTGARPWLFGVARNQLRRRNEAASRSDRLVERLTSEYVTRRAPADIAERTIAQETLDGLSKLPEEEQELLRLRAWEGLSHREIAEIFDISENAVAIRMHRARQRLSALVNNESETDE